MCTAINKGHDGGSLPHAVYIENGPHNTAILLY